MAKVQEDPEITELREHVARILCTQHTLKIAFRLDNLCITRFMYHSIARAILDDDIHLELGSGNAYDHETDVMELESTTPKPAAVVHEAMHAIIDAMHKGDTVRKGTHEAAAYLAEAIWALSSGNELYVDVEPLNQPIRRLAKKVLAHNENPRNGMYVVDPQESMNLQLIMKYAKGMNMQIDRKFVMDGIGHPRKTK
jgi:hypothetical protein